MTLTEEAGVSGTASSRSLADLSDLIEHLKESPVESGLRPEPLAVGRGRLRARLPLNECTRMPGGRVSPFALGTFADLGVGVAVNSAVVDSTGGPTVELTLAMAGQPAAHAKFLETDAHVVSIGPRTGTGHSTICDDTGVVVAHAWGVMSTRQGAADLDARLPATLRFDPRKVLVEPLTEDFARARVALDDTMVNSRGNIHGGLLVGMSMSVQGAFLGDDLWQGLTFTTQFLRPAVPESGPLETHTEFVRRGRTFRTVRTRFLRPDGAILLEATGTSVITAGEENG